MDPNSTANYKLQDRHLCLRAHKCGLLCVMRCAKHTGRTCFQIPWVREDNTADQGFQTHIRLPQGHNLIQVSSGRSHHKCIVIRPRVVVVNAPGHEPRVRLLAGTLGARVRLLAGAMDAQIRLLAGTMGAKVRLLVGTMGSWVQFLTCTLSALVQLLAGTMGARVQLLAGTMGTQVRFLAGILGAQENGKVELEEVNPNLRGGRVEKHLEKKKTVHPTEIRTSISQSSAVELSTTSALGNYVTKAVLRMVPSQRRNMSIFSQQI
uniref:Uncharacterized protein n=1 Tax=Timema shepardi TaxID=629360 RepID=A0A7R9B673_TIMSH|nr:unnamed protein product [Timema shepardi]